MDGLVQPALLGLGVQDHLAVDVLDCWGLQEGRQGIVLVVHRVFEEDQLTDQVGQMAELIILDCFAGSTVKLVDLRFIF